MEDNSGTQHVGSCSPVSDETQRRKRGPYKLYLAPSDTGYSIAVPRTTKWRRIQTEDNPSQCEEPLLDATNEETEEDIFAGTETDLNDGETLNDPDFNIFGYEDSCQDEEVNFIQEDSYQEADNCQDQSNADHDENENENEPLYEGAQVTIGQCLLLLMAFMLGNNLSGVAIGNLLKLLALILPSDSKLPRTKFLFDKYFNVFKDGVQFKLYCPTCNTCTLLAGFETLKCAICELTFQKDILLRDGNFFIYLPLEKQIRDLFTKCGETIDLTYRFTRKKVSSSAIEDIFDGQLYKTIAGGLLMSDPNSLSVSFNCDGVPVFKSSNFGIWPLQGIVNELPPKQRKQNVFLIGLWFGAGKPTMTSFLDPFTKELGKLGRIGMNWVHRGVAVCSRVFACICSCDSVARCVLQNIHQFNGRHGCSWCENPGESIEKGRGHCRVYPEGSSHDMRTHEQMQRNGQQAYRKQEPVYGVKGPTTLSNLPYFDIVRGFVVDNLHCIDLGVTRQLSHLWFDSGNHNQPWYLGRHTQVIDSRLRGVMPPQEVTRVPRSITQRAFWKGSEWHWWLMLYSPVVLYGLLPTQYFRHLLLLVEGVYMLTKSSISRTDINKANQCLSKFTKNFQALYGKTHMTYNIHQLNHLVQTVIDWGPLPCYSSYIFEGFNMVLLKLFHGTQAVPHQIANSFLLYKAMSAICSNPAENPATNSISSFMNEQLKGYAPLRKARKMEQNITFLGASYSRPLSIEERYVVEDYYQNSDVASDAEFFTKAVVNGSVFHCVNYKRDSRRKNFIVGTKANLTFELVVFAVIHFHRCGDNMRSIAFGRQVKLVNALTHSEPGCGILCSHIKKTVDIDSTLEIVELGNIQDKFAIIEDQQEQFYCKLPNTLDRD